MAGNTAARRRQNTGEEATQADISSGIHQYVLHRLTFGLFQNFVTIVLLQIITQREFYIHSSVHRNSMLIRSNKMQQYAGIYLLKNHSTCFGCPSHPSSGVHKTVIAASGTGHSI